MTVTKLSMIAACDPNGIIGYQNRLPWDRLEGDLKRFKELTDGKVLIMGRKTVDSLPKRLPNRTVVMVSRNGVTFDDVAGDVRKYNVINNSIGSAISTAMTLRNDISHEVFIAGGGEIYRWAWEHASKLYLTVAKSCVRGDTYVNEFARLILEEDPSWTKIHHESLSDNDYYIFERE